MSYLTSAHINKLPIFSSITNQGKAINSYLSTKFYSCSIIELLLKILLSLSLVTSLLNCIYTSFNLKKI